MEPLPAGRSGRDRDDSSMVDGDGTERASGRPASRYGLEHQLYMYCSQPCASEQETSERPTQTRLTLLASCGET